MSFIDVKNRTSTNSPSTVSSPPPVSHGKLGDRAASLILGTALKPSPTTVTELVKPVITQEKPAMRRPGMCLGTLYSQIDSDALKRDQGLESVHSFDPDIDLEESDNEFSGYDTAFYKELKKFGKSNDPEDRKILREYLGL